MAPVYLMPIAKVTMLLYSNRSRHHNPLFLVVTDIYTDSEFENQQQKYYWYDPAISW
jgi:hypothetical protein